MDKSDGKKEQEKMSELLRKGPKFLKIVESSGSDQGKKQSTRRDQYKEFIKSVDEIEEFGKNIMNKKEES